MFINLCYYSSLTSFCRRPFGCWCDLSLSDILVIGGFLLFNIVYLTMFWAKWMYEEVADKSFVE